MSKDSKLITKARIYVQNSSNIHQGFVTIGNFGFNTDTYNTKKAAENAALQLARSIRTALLDELIVVTDPQCGFS